MGFLMGPQPSPQALPATPPAAAPPTLANAAASGAMQNARARAAGAMGSGFDSTIATSPQGGGNPSTAKGTLLGSTS